MTRLRSWWGWLQQWIRRLSGQLVLSHVFVAVVVLAFAFGVAQVTFRHHLVHSQMARLTNEANTLNSSVTVPYLEDAVTEPVALGVIHLVQGTLNNRIYMLNNYGQIALEYPVHANVPPLFTNKAVAEVLKGHTYRAVASGNVAIVGVPVSLAPNHVIASNPIRGAVFIESPLSASSRTANSLTRLLLLGELGAVVLVGALAYAISGRLSRPLEQLRQVVAGTGQSDDRPEARAAETQGPVEVRALAHEFNRLEDRISIQMDQLKREADARDALMAHVAHDLRTPLTSIRGFLEAIRDGVAVDQAHDRAVEVAWEETQRLQRLVDRLLTATRIRSEGGTMTPLAVRRWVAKTLERVEPVLEQHHVQLTWAHQDDARVRGNEDYLVEALMNVIDNAIKWSPEGSTIEVATEIRDSHIVISVRDQGPGIPEELLPRVFERFVTGDASRQKSSGLGLSIVDEVARQHHGDVAIRSDPGSGTVVELSLPIMQDASAVD